MNPLADPARRAPRAPAQQDALVPHHARHHHRRRRGHRDGGDRRGREGAGRGGVRRDGHEPAHRHARLDHVGRRARRLRLAAHADLGRPEGDPDRGPHRCSTPRRRCARTRSVAERGAELDDQRARAPRPTTSTSATGRWRSGSALHAVRRRRRRPRSSVLGQTVVDKLFGPNADPSARRCASRTCPSRSSACCEEGPVADGPGLRRRASSSR